MLQYWSVNRPEVVVSLSGGAQDFKLTPRVQELLDNGIRAVSTSARAMFFTPGSNAGVCKMVAGILHRAQIDASLIGVITLACIKEYERLIAPSRPGVASEVRQYPTYLTTLLTGGTPSRHLSLQ